MNDTLTIDEFDALEQIGRGIKTKKVSACVAKNAKHLYGLKYITYNWEGMHTITEKGKQALFLKRCIDGLRSVSGNPQAKLNGEVLAFLEKKGHIKKAETSGFEITTKGIESLADIDAKK